MIKTNNNNNNNNNNNFDVAINNLIYRLQLEGDKHQYGYRLGSPPEQHLLCSVLYGHNCGFQFDPDRLSGLW